MNRRFRRLAEGTAGAILILVVLGMIESYTANRRFDEFIRRTGRIHEGSTETEVVAVAGPPDELLTDLATTDSLLVGAWCLKANATAAMLYSFDHHGWIGGHFPALTSSSYTQVVCLDQRHIVVKTYGQTIYF